jgi:hypothetical protein
MRRGSGNLELIAFQPVGDGPGGIMRTGSFTNEADSGVTLTTLQTLDPGRILAATRITRCCEAPANLSRSKIGFTWWPEGIPSLRRRACTR